MPKRKRSVGALVIRTLFALVLLAVGGFLGLEALEDMEPIISFQSIDWSGKEPVISLRLISNGVLPYKILPFDADLYLGEEPIFRANSQREYRVSKGDDIIIEFTGEILRRPKISELLTPNMVLKARIPVSLMGIRIHREMHKEVNLEMIRNAMSSL